MLANCEKFIYPYNIMDLVKNHDRKNKKDVEGKGGC